MTVSTVIDQLNELNVLHEQMLAAARQKKEAIVENRVDDLTRIVQAESRLLKQIAALELARENATAQALREAGSDKASATVSELAGLVADPAEKRSLLEARESLAGRIRRLKEMNRLNQQLIGQSLAFIDYSLELLTDVPESDAVYRHPQQQARTNRRGLLEIRA